MVKLQGILICALMSAVFSSQQIIIRCNISSKKMGEFMEIFRKATCDLNYQEEQMIFREHDMDCLLETGEDVFKRPLLTKNLQMVRSHGNAIEYGKFLGYFNNNMKKGTDKEIIQTTCPALETQVKQPAMKRNYHKPLHIQTMSAIPVGTLLGFLVIMLISCIVTGCVCIIMKKCFKCNCLSCLFNSSQARNHQNEKTIHNLQMEIRQLKLTLAQRDHLYNQEMLENSARPLYLNRSCHLSPRRSQNYETAPSRINVKKYGFPNKSPSVRSSFAFSPRLKKARYNDPSGSEPYGSEGQLEWTVRN